MPLTPKIVGIALPLREAMQTLPRLVAHPRFAGALVRTVRGPAVRGFDIPGSFRPS